MKVIRFVFFLVITLSLFIFLNNSFGGIPPLGKFLSPHQGFWQNAESENLPLSEEINSEIISSEVLVQFDDMFIPHIYAENDEDLYCTFGYITAYHRLWQMDFYSRVVNGRLSEVLGNRALEYDRLQRRIGLKDMVIDFHNQIMENEYNNKLVTAYTNGVNDYIESLSPSDYPIEFKLLDYKPEKWTTEKSCMAYGLLANTLSKGEADLENTNALMLFGREMFDVLFPDQLGNLDPIYPAGTKWDFDPILPEIPDVNYPKVSTINTIDKPDRIIGSNNFVAGDSKTKSGNPILANEPDLQLTQPSIWYAAHLNSPNINTMGVTVPGTFAVLIGFTDSIAWGVTNSPRDQVDWYSIQFKDESRNEYWYNDQWFKTEKKVEKFTVRGEDTFYDTIVNVHHGPIVYDKNFLGNGEKVNLAMNWIAHKNNSTYDAMFKLNKGKNISDFNEALKSFTGPPQNFVFASVQGDIAGRSPGKFPVKWKEQGKFIMDGSNPSHEWKELIPYEHQMFVINPERGFVSSANQHQVDENYPYYVYDHNFEKYRNRRINERLRSLSNITPEDMMKLQNDNFFYLAYEMLDSMMSGLDSLELNSKELGYLSELKDWDYFAAPELTAPSIFQLWWEKLYDKTWDEFDTISVAIDKPDTYTTSYLLKSDSNWTFFDILETPERETVDDLYTLSFKDAADSLSKWEEQTGLDYTWYQFKNTRINHFLQLEPFSRERVKIGGYGKIVNAAGKTAGPSWRMVVELDPDGIKAWGVYPGSQTGNPGNPNYGHMIDNWASGTYYKLRFDSKPLKGNIEKEIRFKK